MLTAIKGKINSNTILVGRIKYHIYIDRKIIQEENQKWNTGFIWDIRPNGLDIYRAFLPKAVEYICFSSVHGTFSRKDHTLSHKRLDKFKKIESIVSIFSDQNNIRLEINYRKKHCKKTTNTWGMTMKETNKCLRQRVAGRARLRGPQK